MLTHCKVCVIYEQLFRFVSIWENKCLNEQVLHSYLPNEGHSLFLCHFSFIICPQFSVFMIAHFDI